MRQKDVPKELLIGENVWRVRFVRKIEGQNDVLGLCDPGDYVIYLKQGLTPYERYTTFLHEVLHAISYERGFYSVSHKIIYDFSEGLAELFFRNF